MKDWSLRRRLGAHLTIAIMVFWILASCGASLVFYSEISEVLDSSLEETAHRIAPLVNETSSIFKRDDNQISAHVPTETYDHEEYVNYQIRNTSGDVLFRSFDAPEKGWALSLENGFSHDGSWKIYSIVLKERGMIIQVGENIDHRWTAISEATLTILAPILILLPILLLLLRQILNRAFVPVNKFGSEIERRGSEHLSEIQAYDLPREFKTVHAKLNDLLDRVRKALSAERAFADNSAHQLRTPVAAALAQAEMLERELGDSDNRERVKKLSEALRRLGRIVEKILQLARAESGQELRAQPISAGEIVNLVLTDFKRLHPERRFIVRGEAHSGAIRADGDALAIMLQNLIENALNYSDAESPVEIVFEPRGAVRILNHCPPLLPDLMSRLGARFVRGASDARGSGLGLAVVKALAFQTKLNFSIFSPIRGESEGFEAELSSV